MRYTWGYNIRHAAAGDFDPGWSVISVDENGHVDTVLWKRSLTELQVKAIAMILNAEDPR